MERDFNALKYQQRNVRKLLYLKGNENDGEDKDDNDDGEGMINEFVTQQLQQEFT